jgi:hypothetical protein
MKITLVIILLLCTTTILSKKVKHKVPTGGDLKNHYGASVTAVPLDTQAIYHNHVESQLNRISEGAQNIKNSIKFENYPGMENKLNPFPVFGEFKNIAHEAKGLVTPAIAGPKLRVSGTLTAPAEVQYTTVKGIGERMDHVSALDKENNQIVDGYVPIKEVILEKEKGVI